MGRAGGGGREPVAENIESDRTEFLLPPPSNQQKSKEKDHRSDGMTKALRTPQTHKKSSPPPQSIQSSGTAAHNRQHNSTTPAEPGRRVTQQENHHEPQSPTRPEKVVRSDQTLTTTSGLRHTSPSTQTPVGENAPLQRSEHAGGWQRGTSESHPREIIVYYKWRTCKTDFFTRRKTTAACFDVLNGQLGASAKT